MAGTIRDLSVIFLAGETSGQEEKWADLLAKCPWARRVEGDDPQADMYAAAAVCATSSHFITVERDCVVDEDFFSSQLDERLLSDDSVLVWPARNIVNKLCYQHGAIRCWPRPLALSRSRRGQNRPVPNEITVPAPRGYATHHINASPDRAFGHAFREAVRLSTVNGRRVTRQHANRLATEDYRHLLVWMSVGADVENGLWAIYGARLGCKMASLGALNLRAASKSDWLASFWEDEVAPQFRGDSMYCEQTAYGWDPGLLRDALGEVGTELQRRLDLPLVDLDPSQSRFFKAVDRGESGDPRLDVASMASVLDRLANCYRPGGGVTKDEAEAAKLYRLAVGFGSTNAKASLGRMYQDGDRPNTELAIRLLTEASSEGHPRAPYHLGQIYAAGGGVPAEPQRALQYYRLAARRGVGEAMLAAGEILQSGAAGRTDPISALAFFRAAAMNGATVAPTRLRALVADLSPDELALAEKTAQDIGTVGN